MRTFVRASAPLAAKTLDAKWYLDPAVFTAEQDKVFARDWVAVGRSEQLRAPGDFFTAQVAGESLIVTRDKAGELHAFYNVCRHRGTRLCTQESGTLKAGIQCPYHAWTYALDGELLAARNMDGTPGFERSEYPLRSAHLADFDGFLFAALDPLQTFDAFIAPLRGRFKAWTGGTLRLAKRIEYSLQCNWKLVFQNYSECYHCPVIHPQLEKLSASDSGLNDLSEGPFLGGYSTLRTKETSLTTTGRSSRDALPGVSGEECERVYYYTIFPSLLLSLHPDYVMAHFVHPVSPAQTAVTCEWYFDAAAVESRGFDASDAVDFWDLTNRQDWRVNELTQLGIASRAYTPGPYSQQEGLLHAFDRHYLSRMG